MSVFAISCYKMDSMNVSLTTELESFVLSLVESGRYGSSSEVVRAGLRMLMDREELRRAELGEFRRKVQEGLDDLEAGRVVKVVDDEVFHEVIQRGREIAQVRAKKGA